jgi:hypothetical protein
MSHTWQSGSDLLSTTNGQGDNHISVLIVFSDCSDENFPVCFKSSMGFKACLVRLTRESNLHCFVICINWFSEVVRSSVSGECLVSLDLAITFFEEEFVLDTPLCKVTNWC